MIGSYIECRVCSYKGPAENKNGAVICPCCETVIFSEEQRKEIERMEQQSGPRMTKEQYKKRTEEVKKIAEERMMAQKLNPTLKQRILVWLRRCVYLREEQRPGWSAPMSIYLVKCKRHGYFEDYKQGFTEYFQCPECLAERIESWEERK